MHSRTGRPSSFDTVCTVTSSSIAIVFCDVSFFARRAFPPFAAGFELELSETVSGATMVCAAATTFGLEASVSSNVAGVSLMAFAASLKVSPNSPSNLECALLRSAS